MTTNRLPIVVPAIALHIVVTVLVWRDLARRAPGDLRGSKNLWRVLSALNTGNSLVYVLAGRRRLPPSSRADRARTSAPERRRLALPRWGIAVWQA